MAGPAVEAEALPGQARGDVGGHHGGLDQQGTGTAQRVDQRRALPGQGRPAGAHQQGGGQVLLERRVAHVAAIATAVEAVAREVHAQGQPPPMQVSIEAKVRLSGIHIGPRPSLGVQAVHHPILDGLGAEAGVADRLAAAMEIHHQGGARCEMASPVDGCCGGAQ